MTARRRGAAESARRALAALAFLAATAPVALAQEPPAGDPAAPRAEPDAPAPAERDATAPETEGARDLPPDLALDRLPSPAELRELVAPAESVAVRPHGVRLESFRGDTINGVYLVDSDLPTSRHVAFGKDPRDFRYVWFSRSNPLRTNVVAVYQVDGEGPPDVLYWRHVDFETKVARVREFRGPGAVGVTFEYSSGPPCGKATCDPEWRSLPLERVEVDAAFFQPLDTLFRSAAEHGEPHLDQPVASIAAGPGP